MDDDQTFRIALIVGSALVLPVMAYFRIRSQSTREPLDRRKEGAFIYYTLRPLAIAPFACFFAFMINPRWVEWASVPLPTMVRWIGIAISVAAGFLILWTLRNLGPNLTDTVVTRKEHTLVSSGPYHWVRHPFYVSGAMFVLGNGLAAANWFFLVTGAAVIALIVIRTKREEDELLRRFGTPYRAYVERTGRFFPRVVSR